MPREILRVIDETMSKIDEINAQLSKSGPKKIEYISGSSEIKHFRVSGASGQFPRVTEVINLEANIDPAQHHGIERINVAKRPEGYWVSIIAHDKYAIPFTARRFLVQKGYHLAEVDRAQREITRLAHAVVARALAKKRGEKQQPREAHTARLMFGTKPIGIIATVRTGSQQMLRTIAIEGKEHFEPIISAIFGNKPRTN